MVELTVSPEDRLYPVGPADRSPPLPDNAPGAAATYRAASGLWLLLLKNILLGIVTIGLYRFWARTALRRYFWSAIHIDDEPLEYVGRGSELFIGFLIVTAIFIPVTLIYSGLQTTFLDNPSAQMVMTVGYLLGISLLMAAAGYRARRYRLSRTLWRGIRFGQGGSTWHYVGRYFLWTLLALATLGLSVPWACADLARYRMARTSWGDWQGRFEGSANALVLPWLLVMAIPLLALVLISPILAEAFSAVVSQRDFAAAGEVVKAAFWRNQRGLLGLAAAIVLLVPILYAHFSLCWLRWKIAGSRIGLVAFTAVFLPWKVLARAALGYAGLLGCTIAVVSCYAILAGTFLVFMLAGDGGVSPQSVLLMFATFLPAYLLLFLIWSVLRTLIVAVPVLRRVVNGVAVLGLADIAAARQSTAAVDKSGEGLADSFDIGFV